MAGNKGNGSAFAVEAVDGQVRLLAGSYDLTPGQAIGAAFAILGAANRALGNGEDDAIGIRSFSHHFDFNVAEDMAVALVLKYADAPLAFPFSATDFSEFTADAVEVCRRVG